MWWLAFASCTPKPSGPAVRDAADKGRAPGSETAAEVATAGVLSPALAAILVEHWEGAMERWPEWASALGDHRYDDRLTDPGIPAHDHWLAREQEWSLRLASLPDPMLSTGDRVTRDLLLHSLRSDLATSVCHLHEWSVSPRANALVDANQVAEDHEVGTPSDAQNLVARFRAMPQAIDAHTANLGVGLAGGRVENAASVRMVIEMLDAELASPVDGSPMLIPATVDHAEWPSDVLATFRADLRAAVVDGVRPALERYRDRLRTDLLPVAREGDRIGLGALPDGSTCYQALIREHTTLDRSPDALHATGLAELEKIHAEFRQIGARVFGTSDLSEIFARLRTDPALRFASADEIRLTAEQSLRAAEAAVPRWFGRAPLTPCTVDVVPDYVAPYTTIAYYQQARPDGSRPGIYFVNVLAPETRPRHEARALAFHESVPGHHLQIALAQEQGDLPAFRRYGGITAFVEGWALYTERLADEMGLYPSDTDRLGMLSFDAWRASRLVVDTGIHAMGWSRAEAVAFMTENTPLAENNVVNEVDRYVTTPGQALAYKSGQLEIRALRSEAEQALGPAFDIRRFHDEILGGGAVTLPILRQRVEAWIERSR